MAMTQDEISERLARLGTEIAAVRREIQALQPETPDGARTKGELLQNMNQAMTNVNQASLYVTEIV